MNGVANAIIVPHPPLIVPTIGKGEEKKIDGIVKAYQKAAQRIIEQEPDTIVIISPHAPSYLDYIQISKGKKASGDLRAFNDGKERFSIEYDQELIKEIETICQKEHLPAGTLGKQDGKLDHGTMVPLYFLKGLKKKPKFVRIGIGGPNPLIHYQVGQAIQKAAQRRGRKISIVASGDLSHCQKRGSVYGYHECGPRYDAKIMPILDKADFLALLQIGEKEIEEAMVCGHKAFCMMAGALDGYQVTSKALSHSAEFGVGYGVVVFDRPIFWKQSGVFCLCCKRCANKGMRTKRRRKMFTFRLLEGRSKPISQAISKYPRRKRCPRGCSIKKQAFLFPSMKTMNCVAV